MLDTWPDHRASMEHKKGVRTSRDSSSSRISQLLTTRLGDVADEVARRTTPYLPNDLPPDEEGRKAYLKLYSVICGLHHEQTVAIDHGNSEL